MNMGIIGVRSKLYAVEKAYSLLNSEYNTNRRRVTTKRLLIAASVAVLTLSAQRSVTLQRTILRAHGKQ